METITLAELDALLEEHWIDRPEKPLLVFLDAEGCGPCEIFYEKINDPELMDGLLEMVDVRRVIIDGRPPMFAPPAYPAIIGFISGVRYWEGLGDLETTETLLDVVGEWVTLPHSNNVTLSPGYRSF